MIVLWLPGGILAQRFTAYYTKINDDFDVTNMVEDKLFGKYADLIVEVGGKGEIHFTRETSYLPVWKSSQGNFPFEEVIERKGDGKGERPDMIAKYSYVRLIKKSDVEIIVHWRYFPEFANVEWDGVVDEYFNITPSGKVVRSIREGSKKYIDWMDSSNIIIKTYQLSNVGLELVSTTKPEVPEYDWFTVVDNDITALKNRNPLIKFSFDEGLKKYTEKTTEQISGEDYKINGPFSYWKRGVSGSALQFDGYYSSIELNDLLGLNEMNDISVEGWVALAAYPFGWAPIIQKSEWGKEGFYFGIDEEGYPGFHLEVGGNWISVVDSNRIDLFKWYHLAAVYPEDNRTISIYKNGELTVSKEIPDGSVLLNDSLMTIGLNRQKMPPIEGRIRRGKWPSLYGIDGLIDEVRFYGKALSSTDVKDIYKEVQVGNKNPDMQKREMPSIPPQINQDEFGANYVTLEYYETWDNLWRVSDHADVVVTFDELPVNIISWRGISYGHYYVTENGKWVGDQSNEDYRLIPQPGEAEGCLEHMSDKQCRHSHIRIIENTDARIVIHWRYGLVDSRYKFAPGVDGWGGWTDEYWTIYPDGIALRHVPRGIVFGDGWVEIMFLSAPGTKPEDNVNLQAFSVMNMKGEIENLSWENNSPVSEIDNPILTMVNSKSDYKMFNVFPTGSGIEIFGGHSDRSKFHWWNHWPVSQIISDGRGAKAADRIAHSSLSWGAPSTNYLMYGITDRPLEEKLPLASSWNNPPEIDQLEGGSEARYVAEERAYHLEAKSSAISFILLAGKQSPAINPAFVIHNWKGNYVELRINGKAITQGENFRTGFIDTKEGKNLIIWVKENFSSKSSFIIK